MCLIHIDAGNNYVQSIPEKAAGSAGYTNFVGQANVTGGYAGATCDFSPGSQRQSKRILTGHLVIRMHQGYPTYIGRVVAPADQDSGWQLTLSGGFSLWADNREIASWNYAAHLASDAFKELLNTYCEDGYLFDRTDQGSISASAYTVPAYTASQTKPKAILDYYNSFEGWEYGDYAARQGSKILERSQPYFRAPDKSTIHYIVDTRRLARPLKINQTDLSNFGNAVYVYYGSAGAGTLLTDSASITANGYYYKTLDISGANTVLADAQRVGNLFLDAQKIDGVARPPASLELVLNYDSHVIAASGVRRDIMAIEPGRNILLTNLAGAPRTLTATDNQYFIHVTDVRKDQKGEVTLMLNRAFDPAVILARAKAA